MVWEKGFIGADSENLPPMDEFMLANYFSRVKLKEEFKKKAKAERSDSHYKFNEAIGQCRLKREGGCCIIKADITPEHDTSLKPYTVSCKIDEEEETVVECSCDCSSPSPGICTHVTGFISWIHCRNAEDTSSDRLIRYSNESTLSILRSTPRCTPINALFPNPNPAVEISKESRQAFFNKTVELLTESNSQCLLAMHLNLPATISSIWRLLINYKNSVASLYNGQAFIEYCKTNISNERCQLVAEMTKNKSEYFFNGGEKYGRITASRLQEASKCQVAEHDSTRALVNTILGNQNPKSFNVKDERVKLKRKVASVIGKTYAASFKRTGWIIKNSHPIFMASPDGLLKDHVVEIKIPSSKESFNKYFSAGYLEPESKYKAEIMLQMFLCDKQKSLFCVADPEFEANKFVKVIEVNFDKDFLRYLLISAEQFWLTSVYPRLCGSIAEDTSNVE